MKANAVVLAIVLLVLGGIVSPSNGGTPPAIQSTPSPLYNDFVSSNGELGLYLVGKWDLLGKLGLSAPCSASEPNCERSHPVDFITNSIFLVNPTLTTLWAFVTLWGNNEEPAACLPVELSPNATGEIDFGNEDGGYLRAVSAGFGYGYQVVDVSSGLNLTFGAVKVLVTNLRGRPTIGLVGYLKQTTSVTNDVYGFDIKYHFATESRLQPVPPEVLLQEFTTSDEGHTIKRSELRNIRDLCQPTVPIPG